MAIKKDSILLNGTEQLSVETRQQALGSAPSMLFSVPFLNSLKYFFYQDRDILRPLVTGMYPERPVKNKTILWFTDTLNDLNGPSVTLKKLGWLAHERGMNLHLVSSLKDDEMSDELPPNLINLPYTFAFKLPYYDKYTLKIPAVRKSLELLKRYNPDEIYISTPGPIGIFALLAAYILKTKKVAIYHTDFYLQSSAVVNNRLVPWLLEKALKLYYGRMDELHVPTVEYMDILEQRGYDRAKMKIFRRGIDAGFFSMRDTGKTTLMKKFGIRDGVTLLFTGRMSPDKNLDFLMDVYRKLQSRRGNINLLMVGDGPYLKELKARMSDCPRVIFTGKLEHLLLPDIYSGADIFVFPSVADTFGMSVLEAQSCGLPAVVSDEGGPKEIVQDGKTGFVARANDPKMWLATLEKVIGMMENSFQDYWELKEKAHKHTRANYTWKAVLEGLTGNAEKPLSRRHIA